MANLAFLVYSVDIKRKDSCRGVRDHNRIIRSPDHLKCAGFVLFRERPTLMGNKDILITPPERRKPSDPFR